MMAAIALSLGLVLATVFMHYEALRLISRGLLRADDRNGRQRVLVAVLWLFTIHGAEICCYALCYWFGDLMLDIGDFVGQHATGALVYVFFSAEAFSTMGLGDIYPVGPLRLVASIEPINGLLLIGWSTSFTYLAMQRFWFGKEGALERLAA